ncbi:MAG TPA: coenzyme F420-0:L-glutamate ligase, partial [Actinomycetota bacterium]|nr:coenzyme F420-0:L-glutamate ligase [Actinomycetota bacterium]
MSVEVHPIRGLPEIGRSDDLTELLAPPLAELGARDGDVVAVTQKVVSKAEGRVVPEDEGRNRWVERETRRVVARRDDLVISETRHGFVCANAGVDASNVQQGFLTLLPEDPDGSAERLRAGLARRLGAEVAVVVTDTFGRPWRRGLVNVAIGCAGLPSLVDLRGTSDHHGRELEATVVALADEVAAASGLVMGKAERVPAALVRGVGARGEPTPASEIVRPPEEDLFRTSPLLSISDLRAIRSFGPGEVSRRVVEEAVRAACAAPAPHGARPWSFTSIWSAAAKRLLVGAMSAAWRGDLLRDGAAVPTIEQRLSREDALLGAAPVLIVPWLSFEAERPHPDDDRRHAERERFVLSAGAAIQNLRLALQAQGVASCWVASSLFCQDATRGALGMGETWCAMGTVAAGPMTAGDAAPPRPPVGLSDHLRV